jgi:hypothetical protein
MGTTGEAILPDGALHPLLHGRSVLTWMQPA